MPRVKIDYVVSFSSEDPEHPASNLLAWEVSKKKWLCKKGESSCSVVLQLTKAVKISSVHIGAYHSALVEVLVARSEKASDQFQVLVPSCVFVPPAEARRDTPVERVRSFSGEQLAEGARAQRWDRVRVVCSQPYNKHCKYGLSFIHLESAEVAEVPVSTPAPLTLTTVSSDEEEFRPGELFAQHLIKSSDSQGSSSDTGAQIRQATSQALKNISDSSTKLVKTAISKPSHVRDSTAEGEGRADRSRDTLLYTDDDERPHTKIDKVVERHKHQKEKEDRAKAQIMSEKKERVDESSHRPKEEKRTPKRKISPSPPASNTPPSKRQNKNSGDDSSNRKNRRDEKKSQRQPSNEDSDQEGEESAEPHRILAGVVLVLSGYENPRRAVVRNTALALGARVMPDWGPACTHLICAFPGTPKMRAARAAGGPGVPAARAEWLAACAARRRRLPWRWFATAPSERRSPPASAQRSPPAPRARSDTECDTDDEIEKVLHKQKAKQGAASADEPDTSSTAQGRDDGPSTADGPSTVGGPSTDDGPSTDEEEAQESREAGVVRFGGALPSFFDGYTFALDVCAGAGAEQLARYIRAYGGLVLQVSELEADSAVDYVVSEGVRPAGAPRPGPAGAPRPRPAGARHVSCGWVARCHRAQALLPPDAH